MGVTRVAMHDPALEEVERLADLPAVRARVRAALDSLPLKLAEAVELRILLQQLPYRDVAARLGCSESAARVRVMRGLRRLQERLNGEGDGTGPVDDLDGFVTDLREALVHGAARTIERERSLGRRRRWTRATALTAAGSLVAGILGALVAWNLLTTHHGSPEALAPPMATQLTLGEDPFPFGNQTSLAGARSKVPYRILMPTTRTANVRTLQRVWVDARHAQVGLYFRSGILITMEPRQNFNPAARYREVAAGYAADGGRVAMVHGVVALLLPQDAPGQRNPGSVTLTLGDVQIVVMGHYPLRALEGVAASLR